MISVESHQIHQDGLRPVASVAEELGLPLYRLRSWESLYPVFSTEQRDDGQSYYDEQAVTVVRNIARLLYQEGARSHEVVPQLRREGIITDEVASPVSLVRSDAAGNSSRKMPVSGGDSAQSGRLKELEQDNRSLNDRLEEFGRIAVSLKTLEDENQALKQALEESRSGASGAGEQRAYVGELEEQNLLLQDAVERLTAEVELQKKAESARQKQDEADRVKGLALEESNRELQKTVATLQEELKVRQAERDSSAALQGELRTVRAELAALVSENETLRAAGQRQREAEATHGRALEERNRELQRTVERLTGEAREHQKEAEFRKERLAQLEVLRAKLAEMQVEHGQIQALNEELETVRAEAGRCRTLEAENEALRVAQQQQREAEKQREKEEETRLHNLQGTIRRLTAEANEHRQGVEQRQAQLDLLQKKLETVQAANEQIQPLRDELEATKAEAERCPLLEAENEELRQAGKQQQAEAQERRQELERRNLALQATVKRLEAETGERLQEVEARQGELATLREQLAELRTEHDRLQSLKGEAEARHRQVSTKLETAEAERQELVRKLEQSVLIMQSLEDENVRLKRSLKTSEEEQGRLADIAGKVEKFEAENSELKRAHASMAGERERHAQAVERIRTLEAEGVVLHQRLTAQENENRLQARRKEELDRLLRELLGELAEMRKTLTL